MTADSPNYSKYAHLLSPGWLFGKKVVGLGHDKLGAVEAHLGIRTIRMGNMLDFETTFHT